MNKTIKIVSALMIAMMIIMVSTPVFADVDIGGAIDGVKNKTNYSGNAEFSERLGKIIGFLQWAGAIAGVLIISILGIKYMMGSLEEKADYKKSFIPMIVGAVVLVAAPQIAKLIFSIFS